MADEKAVALSNALAQIERQFGKGSIMKMGEIQEKMAFDVISTGSIALDPRGLAELDAWLGRFRRLWSASLEGREHEFGGAS